MGDTEQQGTGAFSRDALVLGKGLSEFLARHQATNDDEVHLLRASRLLAAELLRYVARDVDVQLAQLEQMSIDDVRRLIEEISNKGDDDEQQTTY